MVRRRVCPLALPLALLGACLLGSCTTTAPDSAARTALEDASVTLMQYTHDQVTQMLVVNIEAGDEPVLLERVEVVSGGFTGTEPGDYTATIPAGESLDLRVPLGRADCSAPLAESDISVEFAVPDGETVTVSPDGTDFLAGLHGKGCAARKAARQVPMSWVPRWSTTGSGRALRLVAPLRIGPVRVPDARITGIDGSVIFVAEGRGLPRELRSGERFTLPVTFQPNRCDAHVWETSRGFQFSLRMTFGDAGEVLVPVTPTTAKQQLLTRAWQEQCEVGQ